MTHKVEFSAPRYRDVYTDGNCKLVSKEPGKLSSTAKYTFESAQTTILLSPREWSLNGVQGGWANRITLDRRLQQRGADTVQIMSWFVYPIIITFWSTLPFRVPEYA